MLFNNIETPDWSMYSLSGGAGAIGNVLLRMPVYPLVLSRTEFGHPTQ